MRIRIFIVALLAIVLPISSCSENGFLEPTSAPPSPLFSGSETAPKMVISQVYGAGGNSGALLQHDYVELFNAGSGTATLTGWSLQYASAQGTGNFGATSTQTLALSGSVATGKYFLIKLAGGTVGAALPTADLTGTINMSGTVGKVALVDQTASLGCNGGSAPCSATQLAHIMDLVGFGTGSSGANFYEGAGAAPTISTTRAAFRADHGCTDTNNNSADFALAVPAPRNSSAAAAPCPVTEIGPLDHIIVTGGTSVNVGSEITLSAELQDAANLTINDASATFNWSSADDETVHIVSTTGKTATMKGMQPGGPVTITITATSNGVTKTATPTVNVTGVATIVPSTTVVSEVHYDNTGTDAGEAIEIEGDAGTSLDGWRLVLYNGTPGSSSLGVYANLALSGVIPATCEGRGVVVISNIVGTNGLTGVQNGEADGWALINAQGQITELRSYEGTFTATSGPAAGLTSTAIEADETVPTPLGRSVQRAGNGVWFGPRTNTFGACNPALPLGPQGNVIISSGKTELALAMQTQFFYGGTDLSNQPVTSVVWSTSNTSIVTVDQKGIVTAKGLGSAQLIATAPDGAIGTTDMTVYIAAGSTGIRLGHNTEFGEPEDGSPGDDFLIRRPQYTVSYNPDRGGANWVSWNLDASHIGNNGRCPGTCYSADTALSNAGLPAYTTADWVSGATWDRGHMAPSADWTSSEADNNTTFFLTNFLPQAPDMNQGPWERLESALRDSVSVANGLREAYIIAGGIFTNNVGLGTLLGLGKIRIPNATWKVAVITPAGAGLNADRTLPHNTTVLAVIMPNVNGISNVAWTTYIATIDEIEAQTGYDLLELLRDDIEIAVESDTKPPVAAVDGPYAGIEGESIAMSGDQSSDADGDALTYAWRFGDGGTGSGENVSHTYDSGGTFAVRLIVTDIRGLADTVETTATVVTWSQATGTAGEIVAELASSGKLNRGVANSLQVKLDAAERSFASGNTATAVNQLEAFIHELDAIVRSGRMSEADAAELKTLVTRIINAAS